MKKVGLITFHGAHNYGSMLQAYALQNVIKLCGYHCEIIDFRSDIQREMYSVFKKNKNIKDVLRNIYRLRNYKERKRKSDKFEDFIKNKLLVSKDRYKSLEEIMSNPPDYDMYVCGSDQVWNMHCVDFSPAYFLPFAKEKKCISFAPSLGVVNELYDGFTVQFESLIKNIDYISVRENQAADIINKLTDKEAEVVLDPTFLLKKEKWDKLTGKAIINTPYILFYSLECNDEVLNIAKGISRKYNLPIVNPVYSRKYDDKSFIKVYDSGPLEFINLIKNASLICTNSFHGTAFSIIYRKPFYSLAGTSDKLMSNDSRRMNILKKLNLQDRIIYNPDMTNKKSFAIDYSEADRLLEKEISSSLRFLRKSLKASYAAEVK